MTLTVGSLFSGIGGLDLGLERAGMRVVWQAEIDPYCSRVLARHWPDVPNLGDVTSIDWKMVPRVDLICGGYPCQPFSVAGRQLGDADPRHLWPHMLDAVRVLRPRFALLENVAGHLALGFGRVLGDLAEIGYDAEWDCIPAAAVGAPHRRDRVFVVAYPGSARRRQDPRGAHGDETAHEGRPPENDHVADRDGQGGRAGHVADAAGSGPRDGTTPAGGGSGPTRRMEPERLGSHVADPDDLGRDGRTGQLRPGGWPQPAHSSQWLVEPDVGRVAHGIPARVDRLKALGNAVVPQVAEHIGRLIIEAAA